MTKGEEKNEELPEGGGEADKDSSATLDDKLPEGRDRILDIENPEHLLRFISSVGICAEGDQPTIEYCQGGVSSKTAIVIVDGKWYLVKQAREKLLVKVEWKADKERIAIETLGNEYYHQIVPDCAPKVVYYDKTHYILVREAVDSDYVMWKSDLLSGRLDFRVARNCMLALARVHEATYMNKKAEKDFCNDKIFHQLRVSPYIEYLAEQHRELAAEIHLLKDKILSRKLALVHGDYSPKNTLVKGAAICILDFEIAHFGDPIFDLSFIVNHVVLKAIKARRWASAYLCLAKEMVDGYYREIRYDTREHTESYAVKLLGLFMLGRVDGKSPVEYLVDEKEICCARSLAIRLVKETEILSFAMAFQEIEKALKFL